MSRTQFSCASTYSNSAPSRVYQRRNWDHLLLERGIPIRLHNPGQNSKRQGHLPSAIARVLRGLLCIQHSECALAAYIRRRRRIVRVVQHICESRLEARTTSSYFDINAFAPTPTGAGRIGNAGVGILEAPGTVAVSALAKTTAIRSSDITRGLSVYSRCEGIARHRFGGRSKASRSRHFLVADQTGTARESDQCRKGGLVCTISAGAFS
jgi:hypothetical protein